MEAAIRIKWGKLVPGREKQAMDLFADVTTYFGKRLADGKLTFFEPFFLRTGDYEDEVGFFVVKGSVEDIDKMVLDEKYLELMSTGLYVVEHLTVDFLTVGEGIGLQIERANKVQKALKI